MDSTVSMIKDAAELIHRKAVGLRLAFLLLLAAVVALAVGTLAL